MQSSLSTTFFFPSCWKIQDEILTTTIAIRPPTSPTMFSGGFSFVPIAGNKENHQKYAINWATCMSISPYRSSTVNKHKQSSAVLLGSSRPVAAIRCSMLACGGGELRPSSCSDSPTLPSPWMTAMPRRSRSAYDVARFTAPGWRATITALR